MAQPPEELVARIAARPLWQRVLLPIALVAIVLVIPVSVGRNLIGAERVSISVDSCDRSGPKSTPECRGTWRLADGSTVTGGVGGAVRQGEQVDGWGNRNSATDNLMSWLVPPLMGAAVLVPFLILMGFLCRRVLLARARRRH
ncbi:hypothetical protein ACK8GF_08865 [Micromonosporaceae bacterium DT59]